MMDSVNVLSVGDAQAATGYVLPKPGSTITLQDKSGSIIGQMAKIPMESEPITEVKPIQNLDKGSKRELLSIISKY